MNKESDEKSIDEVIEQTTESLPKHKSLTDTQMAKLADLVLTFSQKMTGMNLYPYQQEFGWRIIYSLLIEDGEEVSALFGRQMGKCFKYNTFLLMHSGEQRAVQDIEVGDLLMGDDSAPRKVLSLSRGKEKMYKIVPKGNGFDEYTVNESHILSLYNKNTNKLEDVPLKELLIAKRPELMGYMNPVTWVKKSVPIDPYWFGLWLGDGTSSNTNITTADEEVVEYIKKYAKRLGMAFNQYTRTATLCNDYSIRDAEKTGYKRSGRNPLYQKMKLLGVVNNKHIPLIYKANDEKTRLKVLAGLIDSDGHKCTNVGHENNCEIEFKYKKLAYDVHWLAKSLGFKSALTVKYRSGKKYYKLYLYGELWKVPTQIKRKQYEKKELKNNPRTYKFDIVEQEVDDYYGFEIDGNKRFLLGDCTVTHNTETLSTILPGMMVLFPTLAKALPNDTRLDKYIAGFKAAIFAPTQRQSKIMYNRIRGNLFNKHAKAILKDPEIDIDLDKIPQKLQLPNGSIVHCETASPQAKIEGYTLDLIILEECLSADSVLYTPNGPKTIKDLVESEYSGFVKGYDHKTNKITWASVLDHLKKKPTHQCYELCFSNGEKHICTGDHPWFIKNKGYIKTQKLYEINQETPQTFAGFVSGLEANNEKTGDIKCTSITKIESPDYVYDIKTSTENFFTNGILSHNCQDIASHIIRASIHPMGAATLASLVKIGTCNTIKSDFYETCRRNARDDLVNGLVTKRTRLHFNYDYSVGAKYNQRYKKYIEKEKRRLGEDSDEFRMKYKLQWMLDRGMYINEDILRGCGISTEGDFLEIVKKDRREELRYTFKRPSNVVTWDTFSPNICAAIDVGRENSTVVTVGKYFPEGAVEYGGKERFPIHIINWLELQGDDHETQFPQILDFLKNYKLERVVVDATGKGDPVYSRLAAQFEELDIMVFPFTFSSQSKDEGYKTLHQEFSSGRFTFPAGKKAATLQKWQRFNLQFQDLEKTWRGPLMVVEKSKDDKNARDDYPDSAMMLCYLVNIMGTLDIEEGMNPFVGRLSGVVGNMMGRAANWYARKQYGRTKPVKPSRNGKWD